MATARVRPSVVPAQVSVPAEVSIPQIQRSLLKLGLKFVGIQSTHGVLPSDLLMFQAASGSTLSVPVSLFADIPRAEHVLTAKAFLDELKFDPRRLPSFSDAEVKTAILQGCPCAVCSAANDVEVR